VPGCLSHPTFGLCVCLTADCAISWTSDGPAYGGPSISSLTTSTNSALVCVTEWAEESHGNVPPGFPPPEPLAHLLCNFAGLFRAFHRLRLAVIPL